MNDGSDISHVSERPTPSVDPNAAVERALASTRDEYKYVADVVVDFAAVGAVPSSDDALERVLCELLRNAARAIDDAVAGTDARGRITVATRAVEGAVELSVTDTGTGMRDATRQRVFEPNFTTKERERRAGLGLHESRRIVESFGGSLRFDTELYRGTTFVVCLPCIGALRGAA